MLADTSLVARRLADLDWVTCASPLYLRARGVPSHPNDLLPRDGSAVPGHAIAGYFSSLSGRAFPLEFRQGEETITVPCQPVVAVNESTAHLNTLLTGLGLGQTYRFMAEPYLQSGRLQAVLADWTRPANSLWLVYPGNRHLNAKLRVFADWVAGVFVPYDTLR